MHNLYLFQPQYSVEYREETNYWLPYSAACIWSYAKQFEDISSTWTCKEIFFRREAHEKVMERMQTPSLCAFSCYQWNKNYCIEFAKKIKKKWPTTKIIFGGSEVNITFFSNAGCIDSIVLGEGEINFLQALRSINLGHELQKVYEKQRIGTLDDLPSPYATGVFDDILAANPEVKWATTLETNRGCPFSCTFCDWGSVTYSKIKKFPLERIKQDLDWIAKNPICYIFCADANFGIFKERDLEIAKMIRDTGDRSCALESFNATFNKNNNEWSLKICDVLGSLNRGFTVSVQSMNQSTLKAIKRDNLGINDLKHIFDLCNRYGVNSYTELILGLPLETKTTFIDGLCNLLELGQHNHVEIWFTDLLVNSELAGAADMFNFAIETVDTSNYLALNTDEPDQYPEWIKLVKSTSTMSMQDMIDSFLYGWMIVNFHMQGYTQVISRYLRQKIGLPYREFYDRLELKIFDDPALLTIRNKVSAQIHQLLTQGRLTAGLSAHNLVLCLSHDLYQSRQRIFHIAEAIMHDLQAGNGSIRALQEKFIFDQNTVYPFTHSCDFDIREDSCEHTVYQINKKVTLDEMQNFDNFFYTLRRKGAIKNSLVVIPN